MTNPTRTSPTLPIDRIAVSAGSLASRCLALCIVSAASGCGTSDRSTSAEPAGEPDDGPTRSGDALESVAFMLDPRLVLADGTVVSVNGSGTDVDATAARAFDGLEFGAEARVRFINADGSRTFLPSPPVENAPVRSRQRIVDIGVSSSGDFAPELPAGTALEAAFEFRPVYRQFDGAPFAVLPDGSVSMTESNGFESPSALETRRAEMPSELTMRLVRAPLAASLHTFTLFVTLDDGQQLEVSWPTLTIE